MTTMCADCRNVRSTSPGWWCKKYKVVVYPEEPGVSDCGGYAPQLSASDSNKPKADKRFF